MPRSLERQADGVAGALAIHLGLYCAVAVCFALALHYLMQPARLSNPGMAALKVSPHAVSYLELLRSEREVAKAPALSIEPEPETTSASAQQVPEVKPEAKKPKAQSTRARPVPRQHPAYAQQPFFGEYRPMY